MAAELHLAEHALALHLLLSTLRAWSTLLSRTRTCTRHSFGSSGWWDRRPRLGPLTNGTAHSVADGIAAPNQTSILEIVPADGNYGRRLEKRRLRYVAVLWADLRDKSVLVCMRPTNGRAGGKEQ